MRVFRLCLEIIADFRRNGKFRRQKEKITRDNYKVNKTPHKHKPPFTTRFANMLKKYMLKLTNTVGTVQYLGKITKENDKNNNNNSTASNSNDDEGSGSSSRSSKSSVFGRKHKKKYRNSMTAEMLLDIGPLVPVAGAGGRSHSLALPDSTPPDEYHLHPHHNSNPHRHQLHHTSDSSLFDERLEPPHRRPPPPHPHRAAYHRSRSLNECDTAAYRRARLLADCAVDSSAGTSPPQLSSTDEDDGEEEEEEEATTNDSSNTATTNDEDDSDEDPMAVLSAAILDLRNTLLYYSLVYAIAFIRIRFVQRVKMARTKKHVSFSWYYRTVLVSGSGTLTLTIAMRYYTCTYSTCCLRF